MKHLFVKGESFRNSKCNTFFPHEKIQNGDKIITLDAVKAWYLGSL